MNHNFITLSKQLVNVWVSIEIYTDENLKVSDYNFGSVNVESIFSDKKEKCNWDNLDFFFENSKSDIKKECKQELIDKGLHEKGIFSAIKELTEEARRLNLYYEGKQS